ncbi:MAG: DUF4422 domain-containing protein [Lachnospiraceae bacterium]|nr:DUF4422 domain-containing protein [Lachnospiraceae bacterium]
MRFIPEHLQSPFCIYGAGIVATNVYTALKTLYHVKPLFFLVSDSEKGGGLDEPPEEIDGIIVKRLSAWKQEQVTKQRVSAGRVTYLIATPEEHHAAIIEALRTNVPYSSDSRKASGIFGISDASEENPHIIPVTNEVENELMEAYYRSCPERRTVSELLSETKMRESRGIPVESMLSGVRVFQAKSHMDKPLRKSKSDLSPDTLHDAGQSYILPGYIVPIQAGAELASMSIADLKDNTGDNISEKNRNYCELTVTYHAWKNCHAAYKGICHYRRVFDIDDTQMQNLLIAQREWDVILPFPSVYYPDIDKEHMRYVKESDWEAMLQALSETAPEYLAFYRGAVQKGEKFFCNFNMLIAKSAVFDDYCSFLFRVLQRTEQLTKPKGPERADRFAGYLGENLTTLYFLKNREKLKIAYAGKLWLV